MNNNVQSGEVELVKAMLRAQNFMESMSPTTTRETTTDAPMIFLNSFGRWCAKFELRSGKPYYAFGNTLVEALTRLVESPITDHADA